MNMKIGSAGSVKSVGNSRKAGKPSSVGGDFSAFLSETDETAAPSVGAAAGVSGIEALLAAQTVGDALQDGGKKRRAVSHGNDILDRLEELRAAILTGAVSKSKLIELAQMLREKREAGLDDDLNAVLDDIELRAEVELAKLAHSV